MPSSTIPRGIRAPKVCGRIHPYFAESDSSISPGRQVAPLAMRHFRRIARNCGLSRLGFLPIITSPPPPDTFPGTVQSQNLDFKQGMVQQFNVNIEHQLPGNVVMTAGYAGSRSTHILVDGLNLNITSPAACPGGSAPVPGYTLGCGYTTPISPFGLISNNNDSAGRDTTPSRSRPKPRALNMASTPCWGTPGPAPSTPASRTASAPPPAQPIGRYPGAETVGLGAVADQSEQPVHRQRDL